MKIIFLGAPGAGKGTQAELVSKRLGIPTISTGAIIREALAAGSELGKKAKEFIEKGALVPDEVVIGIINDRLGQSDCANGYILDGFPRTVPQAEALDRMGVELDAVVSLEVTDETIVDRMSGRRVCNACGASYHIKHNPSKAGANCDKCGAELTTRKDDAPEVVLSRLEVYHSTTEPLKEYYGKTGKLVLVEGAELLEETTKRTMAALGI